MYATAGRRKRLGIGLNFADSPSIMVTREENAYRFHVKAKAAVPAVPQKYSGYFAVSDSSDKASKELKVRVSYGRCRITTTDYEVDKTENIEVTDDGYVYLEADGESTPEIKFSEDFPEYEEAKYKALIAEVKLNDDGDAIKSIIQQSYGMIQGIIWTSSCSSTESAS